MLHACRVGGVDDDDDDDVVVTAAAAVMEGDVQEAVKGADNALRQC